MIWLRIKAVAVQDDARIALCFESFFQTADTGLARGQKFGIMTKSSDELVFPELSDLSESALRCRMYRLCRKAGVKTWPKIFQNLRSTRETILEQFYPRGTVCEWMGNTEDVAEDHYIQEMKEFRAKAASEFTTDTKVGRRHNPDSKQGRVSQWVPQNTSEKGGDWREHSDYTGTAQTVRRPCN